MKKCLLNSTEKEFRWLGFGGEDGGVGLESSGWEVMGRRVCALNE